MKKEQLPSLLIFLGFSMILFLPLGGWFTHSFLGHKDYEKIIVKEENRLPAPPPELPESWEKIYQFPAKAEAFFNDRYAFRSNLIKNYARFAWYVLKKPINPDDCLIGQNNYLFLGDKHAQVFSQHSGATPVSETELTLAEEHQTRLKNWCDQRNITYLCVVPPDKHSVYPEYLPKWVRSPRKSLFIEELADRVKHKDFILNLKPGMLEAKSRNSDRLYPRWDSHWNGIGAYEGYKILMNHLSSVTKKTLKIVESPQFIRNETKTDMDLTLMSKTQGFISDTHIIPLVDTKSDDLKAFTFSGSPIEPFPGLIQESDCIIVENKKALNKGTLLIVRDSFSTMLSPFLYASFEKSVFIGHEVIPEGLAEWLNANKPDYLICEHIERGAPKTLSRTLKDILLMKMPEKDILNYIHLHPEKAHALPLDNPALFPGTYCTVSPDRNGLEIRSDKNDFCIELTSFEKEFAPLPSLILQIELTAPEATSSQIFYQTDDPAYNENKSESRKIVKGKQILRFYLQDASGITKIRFDPGELPGDYFIHSINIIPVE